ncbi:Carboxylic ester hydrolase OS=Streptomyces glaucescens OX=1907 GN=SGLAU_30575 PE=3 SV=1 [Streptomyces glaucescens]
MQQPSSTPWGNLAGPGTPSEDCLYLNVHTPAQRSPLKRPVMVWIHGGGFTVGSGSFSTTAAPWPPRATWSPSTSTTASGRSVTSPTPGWPSQPPHGLSGNYGLLDQQAALRWVRDNIAAFGGDPGNVQLVFGESAGGGSVCQHLVSPAATGLFRPGHRPVRLRLPAAHPGVAAEQRQGLGLPRLRRCRLPARQARPRSAHRIGPPHRPLGPERRRCRHPRAGDRRPGERTLPPGPGPAGHHRRRGPGSPWRPPTTSPAPATAEGYPAAVRALYGARTDEILSRYPLSGYGSPAQALGAILTDSQFACPQPAPPPSSPSTPGPTSTSSPTGTPWTT